MRSLELFLRALENSIKVPKGTLIMKTVTSKHQRFAAFTKINCQIYNLNNPTEAIVEEEISINTTIQSLEEGKEDLIIKIIEKLLKFYGI